MSIAKTMQKRSEEARVARIKINDFGVEFVALLKRHNVKFEEVEYEPWNYSIDGLTFAIEDFLEEE